MIVRPFKAVRPSKERAEQVAALPYDVMNSEKAREMVKGNPYSFLHVDKAEIDLPKDIDQLYLFKYNVRYSFLQTICQFSNAPATHCN